MFCVSQTFSKCFHLNDVSLQELIQINGDTRMRYITEWSVKFDTENIDITNTRATIKLAPVDPETWKPHREFKDNWDDTEKAYMKVMSI